MTPSLFQGELEQRKVDIEPTITLNQHCVNVLTTNKYYKMENITNPCSCGLMPFFMDKNNYKFIKMITVAQ